MPVTPFHFGPGLLLRALFPRVSFTAFVAANVLIDLESLYFLIRGEWPVHRALHTLPLASLAGLAAGAALHTAVRAAARRRPLPSSWRAGGRTAALLGGWLGGVTHALLDGVMHADALPFRPLADVNPLLGIVDVGTLHLLCVVCGLAGMACLALRGEERPG